MVQQGKTAADILSSIASQDVEEIVSAVKFVKEGYKLDNSSMQVLLFNLKTKYNMSYRDLLAVYLSLDAAVEKGALTNEVLDYLKTNPDGLSQLNNKTDE